MKKFISTIIESLPLNGYSYEFGSDCIDYNCYIRFCQCNIFSQSLLTAVSSLPDGYSFYISCPVDTPVLVIYKHKK